MKQVNYLDEDYKKNLRNKVWELLKNGDIEEADKIFLEIMAECGVNKIKRNFMYRMVRIFGSSHFRRGE